MHLTGLDTNACPLGNSKFILLSDKLNICLWLSACQVEKINYINSSWFTICQRLSQLEATFWKCKPIWPTMHPFLQVLFVSFMLVGVNCCFSCDQAALQMVFSVCPSVCPSVRPSVCLSHLFDYVPIIISSWNFQELLPMTKVRTMQKVKVRGQRSRSQRSQPNLTVSGL